jgi:hypothetical protein
MFISNSAILRENGQAKTAAGPFRAAISAVVVLCVSLALAWFTHAVQASFHTQTERAVLATGFFFALILAAVPGAYLLYRRRSAQPETAGLAFLSACAVSLLAIYFFWVSAYLFFPADILTWSEGDFVNDILKFSVGYPLYTPQVNNDSYTYVPGPQLLTHLIAWTAGKAFSITAYRVIQLGYTAIAAFLALLCCRRILRLARPESRASNGWLWNSFWYAAFFLIATNPVTNHFAHSLHDDALAQLTALGAFYLLLVYIESRSARVLAGMALIVPAGLLIKQSLLIWGALYIGFLFIWDRPRKRLVWFTLAVVALVGATLGLCYALWGDPFFFWIFRVLRNHSVSPLRSFQHVLDTWQFFAAGLLGGVAVLRGRKPDALFGAWLVSLGLMAVETYTSGIAWMLNHIGPGSLLAGVWLMAGLASFWNGAAEARQLVRLEDWIRGAAVTATVALVFGGMGLVRIPLWPMSEDAYRYVHDIEREFEGQPSGKILLDVGTWVYIKDRVIMGDRAPCIGELGYAASGDFSGFLSRIAAKRYTKILVRNLYDPHFWYENSLWPRPRGLREALLNSYRETGHIRAAEGPKDVKNWTADPYLFGEITILEPKAIS